MLLDRRQMVAGLIASGITLAGTARARAAAFPAKDITFIIPFASGGGFDGYVRAIIPAMQDRLPNGIQVIPDNVDGAGGAKAANQLFRAKPDGYTISVLNVPGVLILQQQNSGVGFDLGRLSWICNMGSDSYGLLVSIDSPIRSIADMRALSRQRPIKFTSTGPASTAYSATRIASHLLDINSEIIAGYKGTNDYIVAAMRGDGDAAICSLAALAQFRAGNLVRVLASFEEHSSIEGAEDATTLRSPELTQILQLRPVAGPPKLPPELVSALADTITGAMKDPKVVAWAVKNGASLDTKGPEETLDALHGQALFIEKWKDILTPV
jgi:tripartite-type tricarboxylate transporter receptor subunit TctC